MKLLNSGNAFSRWHFWTVIMNERIILKNYDVVSMDEEKNFVDSSTAKISEIRKEIEEHINNDDYQLWFQDGVECAVLLGDGSNGWMKGRVRITCEFIPDEKPVAKRRPPQQEPTSPLTDLRDELNL